MPGCVVASIPFLQGLHPFVYVLCFRLKRTLLLLACCCIQLDVLSS
jgi:hypothetical protein